MRINFPSLAFVMATGLSLSFPGLAADPFSVGDSRADPFSLGDLRADPFSRRGELRTVSSTCPGYQVCSVEFTGEAHGILIKNDEKKEAAREILNRLVQLFPAIPDHATMLTATLRLANGIGQEGEGYSGTEEGKIDGAVIHATAQHIHKDENKYCADYVYMDGNAGDKLIGTASFCLDPQQAIPIGSSEIHRG